MTVRVLWAEHARVSVPQIEQVSQLAALVQAQVEYHSRSAEILTQLSSKIDERSALPPACIGCFSYNSTRNSLVIVGQLHFPPHRIREASGKPRKEYVPKPRTSLDFSISENHNGGIHGARSPGGTLTISPLCPNRARKLVLLWVVPRGVKDTLFKLPEILTTVVLASRYSFSCHFNLKREAKSE